MTSKVSGSIKRITPQPAAVIFDMDGLMLDTERIYHQAWQEAAQALGYAIETEFMQQLVGIRTVDCQDAIVAYLGATFPLQAFEDAWMARWETIAARDGIPLKPGLLPLLARLEELGMPKAVGTSSTGPEAERSLGATDLRRRFPVVVTGDQVPNGKPAPDIYLKAAHRLGVRPADCVVFEDSNAGAEAAHRAGMAVYVIPDVTTPDAATRAQAAAILSSLDHALGLFEEPV